MEPGAKSPSQPKLPELLDVIGKQLGENRALIDDLQSKVTQIGYRTDTPPPSVSPERLTTTKDPETLMEKAAAIHRYLADNNEKLNLLVSHISQLM